MIIHCIPFVDREDCLSKHSFVLLPRRNSIQRERLVLQDLPTGLLNGRRDVVPGKTYVVASDFSRVSWFPLPRLPSTSIPIVWQGPLG